MKILGIETTCDETGISILEFKERNNEIKVKILANELATQFGVHSKFGGVVPILAGREHEKNLPILLSKIEKKLNDVDYIAFAVGPGLPPALVAGKKFVVELAKKINKNIIPVNHLIGHLFISLIKNKRGWQKVLTPKFPAIGVIISGGHTIFLYMRDFFNYKKIGETLDDAIGESLDKGGRLLGLEYPGGPKLEKLAKNGKPLFTLPQPLSTQKNLNLSFAGLKTAFAELVYEIQNLHKLDEEIKRDLASSFQKAVFDTLLIKLKNAVSIYKPRSLIFGGGVIANSYLKKLIKKVFKKTEIFLPSKSLATDNGVQIALAGFFIFKKGLKPLNYDELDINPILKL